MNIKDYLTEKHILLDIKTQDKKEALNEIFSLLRGEENIVDFETFVRDVFEREKLSTTGIGNGVAIPHARTDAVKDFVIAFGRSVKGVEFNALDGKPVTLIFLIGTPAKKGLSEYLKTLARLSRLLQRESFRDSLMKSSSPGDIIKIFEREEK